MKTQDDATVYESSLRFDENRIRAAAVYCSDGRFGEQIDDFLHNCLKLPRCDRLVVPGGAGCLAGHFLAFREEEGLVEQLRFLIRAHDVQRVVLIAHQDCAFYSERLHVRCRGGKCSSGKICRPPLSDFARSAAIWRWTVSLPGSTREARSDSSRSSSEIFNF